MEAEQARTCSEAEHKKTAANYNSCINHMKQLEKKLKRSINKSRSALMPCFVMDSKWAYALPAWASPCVTVFVCEKERPHLSCVMKSRCFVCWLCTVHVRAKECSCPQRTVILLAVSQCFTSLSLNFSSFPLPAGHILNWKPSITYNLRYVY